MLSLYVHVPFCVRKCRYCGFYSTVYNDEQADRLLKAMTVEMALRFEKQRQDKIATIYIGGGTPTILKISQLQYLIRGIRERIGLVKDREFTLEANPNSCTDEMLAMLREEGVNRLSIGVQSFTQQILDWLGRPHTAADAERAVDLVRKNGFVNFSIDLIYGVPGLSAETWKETLQHAIGLQPTHISAYGLSLDEGSKLYNEVRAGNVELPDDDSVAGQYEDAVDLLEGTGYRQYEISNFCRPSFECRHNMNYWDRGEYLGIGPGAWSFSGDRRKRNIADTGEYISRIERGVSPTDFEEVLDSKSAAVETLFLGLRRIEGLDLDAYAEHYGSVAKTEIVRRADALADTKLYVLEKGRLRLSRKGMLLSNEALSRIIS